MLKIANGEVWSADLPALALCLDENLKPRPNINFQELIEPYEWYAEHIDSLSYLLIDFKKTIGFKNNYNIDFKPFMDSLKSNRITEKLNDFYRTNEKTSLKIVLDPLNNILSKAITFAGNSDKERIFLIDYLCEDPNEMMPLNFVWNANYRRIVVHENSHIYTQSLFEKYYDKELDSLVNQEKFKDEYTDIDEIVVRGLTAKILALNYGDATGEYEISRQPKKSRIVYDYLDNYIDDKSMTFENA